MTRATLLALAERVEAATGGSGELDAHIRCALFGKPDNFVKQSHINGAWCVWRIDGAGREVAWDGNGLTQLQRLGAFTASLDAAMSLVPSMDCADWDEGIVPAYFSLSRSTTWESGPMQRGWAAILHPVTHETIAEARASTPALALTAACIRALAVLEQDNG